MDYYRRHLPHILPQQAIFSVTFRLVNTLPLGVIVKLKKEFYIEKHNMLLQNKAPGVKKVSDEIYRQYFLKYDEYLDAGSTKNKWLKDNRIANIVSDAIKYRDKHEYDLVCFCVMPNHVHLVVEILDHHAPAGQGTTRYLTKILQSLKSYTAVESNRILGRSGQFWQRENYDRVVRNERELEETVKYILYNPVKAGLVANWKNWEHSYCRYDIL